MKEIAERREDGKAKVTRVNKEHLEWKEEHTESSWCSHRDTRKNFVVVVDDVVRDPVLCSPSHSTATAGIAGTQIQERDVI